MCDNKGQTFLFRDDGYFNTTDAAKQFGKRLDHFFENEDTKRYLDVMEKTLAPRNSGELGIVDVRGGNRFMPDRGKDFSNWIKEQIELWGFVEGEDYVVCSPNLATEGRGGHNRVDYHITIDMAKQLSMVNRDAHIRVGGKLRQPPCCDLILSATTLS